MTKNKKYATSFIKKGSYRYIRVLDPVSNEPVHWIYTSYSKDGHLDIQVLSGKDELKPPGSTRTWKRVFGRFIEILKPADGSSKTHRTTYAQ